MRIINSSLTWISCCLLIIWSTTDSIDASMLVNANLRSTADRSLAQQQQRCGGCPSCTPAVWNARASGPTCGDRITYLKEEQQQSEHDACHRVGVLEFPNECGGCSCDDDDTTVTAHYCGCQQCSPQLWESDTTSSISFGARVTWVESEYSMPHADACTFVAHQFPDTTAGTLCNPETCATTTTTTRPIITCGRCASTCTANVLNTLVMNDGVTATCGERIEYLMTPDGGNWDELDACSFVAEEFPTACGPHCDPDCCNGECRTQQETHISPPPQQQQPQPQPQPMMCGCNSCTANVLDRVVVDADGVALSCRERIEFLQDRASISEFEACSFVAQGFPRVCGPDCDPACCNGECAKPTTPLHIPAGGAAAAVNPFGENVILLDPSMSTGEIQQIFDRIFLQQVNNEMGSERYGIYFLPGVYGSSTDPLQIQIGYYTEVMGLGQSPNDVVINGKIEVYNRCFAKDPYNEGKFIPTTGESGLCFALNNFWRSLSNLSINVFHRSGTDSCRSTAMFWAISQASSMRRVEIRGSDVALMDYCTSKLKERGCNARYLTTVMCTDPGFASGGFIADSKITGTVINGSQQQFLARNMEIDGWEGAVWNTFFLGVSGAPSDETFPDPPFTSQDRNPLSREKPFLFQRGDGQYFIQRPFAKTYTTGTSWGANQGEQVPLSDFFVTNPSHSVDTINQALQAGKHLLLTPGVYTVDRPILVTQAQTMVLGLGHATIKATHGSMAMKVANQHGIIVAGVTFDGGPVESSVLLQVGEQNSYERSTADFFDPITLQDVYFRIGGPYIGKARVCLEVNSNQVLIDHTWVWRADHGIEPFDTNDGFEGDNQRWRDNIGTYGVVVNGNDVTASGLFVEHFQKHNVLWNGERGRVFFFQNELPYDPPTQEAWNQDSPTLGWAGYKVSDWVETHELWGGGVYCYNRNDPSIRTQSGFEAPEGKPGVQLARLYTRNLSGPGAINHILNGRGPSVDEMSKGPVYLP